MPEELIGYLVKFGVRIPCGIQMQGQVSVENGLAQKAKSVR